MRAIHREYVKRFISGEADSARVSHTEDVVYKIQDDPRVTRVGKFYARPAWTSFLSSSTY